MRRVISLTLLMLAAAAWVGAGEIKFADTFDNALKVAGEQNRSLLVTFYADW